MSREAPLAALAASLLLAGPARAHEVLHDVERGRAIGVRAYFADGEAMAYAAYEVYSPADRDIPHQKGRTDRNGWLAFVPDAPGRWRVKIVEPTGHGLDLEVDAASPAGAAASSAGPPSTAAFVLRPLLGLAAVGAAFAALVLVRRRKGRTP